jgi:hypothetical protein
MPKGNDWNEWRKLVLHELETHSSDLKEIRENVSKVKTEIAMLKVKSGLWGAVAGMIPVIILLLINHLK